MTLPLSSKAITEAYIAACRLEVRTLKPGNVHVFAEGHGMTVADFDRSADVSATYIADPALPVGTRIRRAVEATFDAVATNTNLGIVLLSAPLAAAAGHQGTGETMRERVAGILAALDHDDAREVYKAITRANPAGLGERPDADVRQGPPANWTLRDAMQAAAARDMIALEYASGFAGLFALAETYEETLGRGAAPNQALALLFIRELASRPDTHIARKHGPELAHWVMQRAADVLTQLDLKAPGSIGLPENRQRLLGFDAELKERGANPGSLADLACAAAFLASLEAQAETPPLL
jgi:triphosphoribosyl-dephospho-CoA synthase